jgi:hypothetical protein
MNRRSLRSRQTNQARSRSRARERMWDTFFEGRRDQVNEADSGEISEIGERTPDGAPEGNGAYGYE